MESERVEMSVGGGLVNGNHAANGVAVNGAVASSKQALVTAQVPEENATAATNGAGGRGLNHGVALVQDVADGMLNMISTEFYLPMAKLVSRSAQECWNDMQHLVERLMRMPVPAQTSAAGMSLANDQTKANLDKKDALLNFANKHKAIFVKLMVLLKWSKRGEEVRKTIELNYWLVQRRAAFTEATFMVGQMMQDLANSQVPNPDLYTAAEVLATGRVRDLPVLEGYIPRPRLSATEVVQTLRRLDQVLCSRLALGSDVPRQLQHYHIHDGRVTFTVSGEFEVDLSVANEAYDSTFFMVDMRFLFKPAPLVPDAFVDEVSGAVNSAIDKDGLAGAYELLHDITLSCQLSELSNQAQSLARGLWAGHLKVELIRRLLVVQYWVDQPGPRHRLEIGIHSGRRSGTDVIGQSTMPKLSIRWLRSGKVVENHNILFDQSRLSFETILRTVIARHIDSIFESVYDRFLVSPLYADGELEIEQTSDPTDPALCALEIQLSKTNRLSTCIDAVSGAIVLSPASERTNRIQAELARSKSIVDDFVGRISNLRCAIAESKLHAIMPNSGWQHLPSFTLSHAELKASFAQSVTRSIFYRRRHWLRGWILAVTHSNTGDFWWLTRRLDNQKDFRLTQVVRSRPLHLEGPLTPAYLEQLAEYLSAVIVLQSNVEYLQSHKIPYRLSDIPGFCQGFKLPSLRFEFRSSQTDGLGLGSCISKDIQLSYRGADEDADMGVVMARANFNANAANLKELATSKLDNSVSILPQSRQVMIRNISETGSMVIEAVVSKLRHVDNIVACAATIKRSSYHALRSLSPSTITVVHTSELKAQHQLVIHFPTPEQKLRLEFLPLAENPHQYLAAYATQIMLKSGQSLSHNLEEVLALLRMTEPLVTYLYSIQHSNISIEESVNAASEEDLVRVHVIPRQAAAFGLGYFARSARFPRDVIDAETPKKLLARFEILPKYQGKRTLWVVRPAIEEFNAYNRSSFPSKELRDKVYAEIFRKQDRDWLRLDEGAAVSSETPEKLLSKIHTCITEWLKGVLDTAPEEESKEAIVIDEKPNGSATNKAKTSGPTQLTVSQAQSQPAPQRQPSANMLKQQQPKPKPTSNLSHGQRPGQNFPGSRSNNNTNGMRNPAGKAQEVITLD